MKSIISFITFVILSSGIAHAMQRNISMNPLLNKPVFSIQVKLKGSAYAIEINGIVVLEDYSRMGGVDTVLPVTHWMHNKVNEIAINIFPHKEGEAINPDTYLSVALVVSDADDLTRKKYVITDIVYDGSLSQNNLDKSRKSIKLDSNNKFSNSNTGDIVTHEITREELVDSPGSIYLKRKVEVSSNLPEWSFFNSDSFPMEEYSKSDENFYAGLNSLLKQYLPIHNSLKTGDIDAVLPMFSERNKEYDAALYLPPGTMEKRVKETLLDMANDPDTELLSITENNVGFEVFPNSKLVKLVRDSGNPAIVQNFKSGSGSQNFDMIFRYEKGKWILTR